MTDAPRLQVAAATKRYPGVMAFDAVDLTVEAGSIHALLGENGAGKSTLIKMITGVHRADDGTLRLDGRDLDAAQSARCHRSAASSPCIRSAT